MFFTLQVLSRKGSLGTVWIAAHLDKKLKRQQISDTDIRQSVDLIMNPEAPFALRLSSQLLFGLVRVYKRQVAYLMQDCNDALNRIHDAFVRTTLPEVDEAAALKSLTLPENFFNLNAMELSAFCGILEDAHMINEDDSFVEAFGPSDLFKRDAFEFEDGSMDRPGSSGLDMQDRELPPLMEIIPEEEITKDVMRDHSSIARPRLGSLAEAVVDQASSKDMRNSGFSEIAMEKQSLSVDAQGIVDELAESIPKTPDNLSSQRPPVLPTLDIGESQMLDKPEAVQTLLQTINHEESMASKPAQKKYRVAIDKKSAIMSNSAFRKMHKQTVKDTQKARHIGYTANSNVDRSLFSGQTRDDGVDQCCVKQVLLSAEMATFWKERLQLSLQSLPSEGSIHLGVERSQSDAPHQNGHTFVPTASVKDDAQSVLDGFNMEDPHESGAKRLPVGLMTLKELNELEPAGETSFELPLEESISLATTKTAEEEERRSSRLVLTHLKRRFTEESHSINPTEEDIYCPSPKRRRLPSTSPVKSISMFDVMKDKKRVEASRWFYELLVLKSHNLVKLQQSSPYADIHIHEIHSA